MCEPHVPPPPPLPVADQMKAGGLHRGQNNGRKTALKDLSCACRTRPLNESAPGLKHINHSFIFQPNKHRRPSLPSVHNQLFTPNSTAPPKLHLINLLACNNEVWRGNKKAPGASSSTAVKPAAAEVIAASFSPASCNLRCLRADPHFSGRPAAPTGFHPSSTPSRL